MITYRQATMADVIALAAMRYDYWAEDGHDPAVAERATFERDCAAFLRRGLASGAWTCWLAEEGGEIISHIYIQRIAKLPKPSILRDAYGYVTNVYTRPEYRRQGIGALLMEHVRAWALEQDLEFLIAWPSEASVSFYDRAGFAPTEAVVCPVRPYVD